MASPYEAYKVRELVTAYRSDPTMFTDDQLDQLEALAYDNGINFKRINSEFNLNRAIRQAFAGAVEGFTTFDLMSEKPRNTGEAIFRQIGHLVGFAPGIAKAPILASSKIAQRVLGKKDLSPLSSTLQRNRFTQAALDHIDILSTKSIPMQFSRLGKLGLDKVLTKTGADSAELLKRGSVGRQIADEAIGLGFASGISNVWKGEDAVLDGFIGGAIAGGAFGGLGNFVSVGNLYKGTPQQVERANLALRTGVGSLITGLPSTLAEEPTEMQIYNYLLGGFFGYNARPAVDKEASKWFNNNRNPRENFRPEESKDFKDLSKEAKDYIRYEHPMGYESSQGEAGGSSGVALRYLNRKAEENGETINFRQEAIDHFKRNNIQYTEKDVLDYYRERAIELYDIGRDNIRNAVVFRNNIYNNEQIDQMDTVQRDLFSLRKTSNKIFDKTDKFDNSVDVAQTIKNTFEQSNNDIEIFRQNIKNAFGNVISPDINKELTQYFIDKSNIMQPIDLPFIHGNQARLALVENERIGDVTIREKAPMLPIQKLLPDANIRFMTHAVLDGSPVKILGQTSKDGEIVYDINQKQLGLLNDVLASKNRYIFSANKDKLNVFTSEFRDDNYTLDDIFNILSRSGRSLEQIQKDYDNALQIEYQLFGKNDNVAEIHRRKFISNIVNESQLEGLPVEEAYRFIQEDSPYFKDVVDFNKRMQLATTRMFYMTPSSFRNVADTNQGQSYNIIIINDKDVANTDGGGFIRNDFMNARNSVMGLDKNKTGADKPVTFHRTPNGVFAQKSAGFRGFEPMQKFMKDNKIHEIVYTSSAKRKGTLPITELSYGKDGQWKSDDVKVITLPITSLQISSGTFENSNKDAGPQNMVIQFYGQINNQQAPEYIKEYDSKILTPSLRGSDKAVELVNKFSKDLDIDSFAKEYMENKLTLDDLPIEFAVQYLSKTPGEPASIFLMDRIMKAENRGELDEDISDFYQLDNDSSFADFHSESELLINATKGTHVPRRTLSFIKNNYHNAVRKYFVKRITNPKYPYSGKSWMEPYEAAEAVQFIEFDPFKSGDRSIKEGEFYLNDGHRQMPVVFRNKKYTLDELWNKYTREYAKGLSKEELAEYDEALTYLIIRTPSDSVSGVRAVRLRGWTNKRGYGSLLHKKDKDYSGGADHDSDYYKMFQGLGNKLINFYKNNKDERARWETDIDYVASLNNLFKNQDMPIELREGFKDKFNIFSPAYRFLAGRNSSTAKNGLGFGLAGKGYLMNLYDYVGSKGGVLKDGELTIKNRDPEKFKEFLDQGTMIVNKSADASKDPTVLPYTKHRDILLNTLFEISNKKGPINSYDEFIKATSSKLPSNKRASKVAAIIDSVRLSKPNQTSYNPDGSSTAMGLFEYIDRLNSVKNTLGDEALTQVYPAVNRRIQQVFEDGLNEKQLKEVQRELYNNTVMDNYINNTSRLVKKQMPKQFLVKSKTAEYLEKHFDILASELSFTSTKQFLDTLNTDKDKALDMFGKDIGQYATMELLTKQFVDIQNAFFDKNRLVNTVDSFYPNLKQEAFDVKDRVLEVMNEPERDNVMNLDIDARIRKTMERLQDIERSNGLPNRLLQDYYGYWLLSPIRNNPKTDAPASPQYYKMIHTSRAIPRTTKEKFYKKMDEIYDRAAAQQDKLVRIGNIKKNLKDSVLSRNAEINKSINELVEEGGLRNLAVTSNDAKEIDIFKRNMDKHPFMTDDFNNWFTQFMGSTQGQLRDATTITMDDVKFINNWLANINTKKGLELGLKVYYQHPLTTSQQMEAMNFHTRGMKIRETVRTGQGNVKRDVTYIYSPVESIARYIQSTESNINKYDLLKPSMRSGIDKQLALLEGDKQKDLYIDNIIEYREGRKTIDDIDKTIDKAKFLKLNDEITKFNKDMWEFWVTTKDISGREYDWNRIDVQKEYGKINKYIRYDNNGRFDFKLFDSLVYNQKQQNDDIINKVGIDGILRSRYEYKLEKSLIGIKGDKKKLREEARSKNKFFQRKKRDYSTYIHHSIRNGDEGLLRQQAEWIDRQEPALANRVARDIGQDNPFLDHRDRIVITDDPAIDFEQSNGTMASPLRKRGSDPIPFKRTRELFVDYQDALIQGYFRNLMKFKAQGDIDRFLYNMRDYKPSAPEAKKFKELYKNVSKAEIPDKYRYNNYVDVWADFIRMYAETGMGYNTTFSTRMKTDQGRQLLHLNKKNMFYMTSDEVMANNLEKIYQSKFGGKEAIPFFNDKAIPKNREARQLYFYNTIRNLGRLEAKYQLLSLLANTGSYSTNIFGGGAMTAGSAGMRNMVDAQRNSVVRPMLLQDAQGVDKVFLRNGQPVTNRKQLSQWLEEKGFYDNYLQNEFEVNPQVKARFKELGVNIKDFSRDFITALRSKKGERDQSVSDVMKKYGVSDTLTKAGGFLMQESERTNRKTAFIAHALQTVKNFGDPNMTIDDPYVFQQAMKGIEMTQFLYQNAFRPPFMATTTGKVLNRFKLFAFNSVRIRKEFYKQAKAQGLKPNTEAYERFKDTFVIDTWMYILGAAFMFSIFDTVLPPPWDWIQAFADYTFGTKEQKKLAYFEDPLGPLTILKPPIARVPEAGMELLTGNWDDFTGYTMYTLLPFGRGIRQAVQLSDDRVGRGTERAPEILFRIPYNKFKNRIERAKRDKRRADLVDELLEQS